MPLYEYQCRKCGKRFENIQKFSDPLMTRCPSCKGRLEKLVSAPAIRFKGTGWYVTDYGGKSGEKDPSGPLEGSSGDKSSDKSTEKSGDKPGEKSADRSGDKGSDKAALKPAGKSDSTEQSSGNTRSTGGKGQQGGRRSK